MIEAIRQFVTDPIVMSAWVITVVIAVGVLIRDLLTRNAELGTLMKVVWVLTVLYSGLLGLAVYYFSGRKQISCDSLWRRSWRSDAHCYSGCGAGEIIGLILATAVIGLTSNLWVGLITFTFAYITGFTLTVGPLLNEGESWGAAIKDAFWGETVSITAMELSAIGVDLFLAGKATIGEPLFWASLVISLTIGLLVAYPFNVGLIHFGVKEGMMNPQHAGEHGHGHGHSHDHDDHDAQHAAHGQHAQPHHG